MKPRDSIFDSLSATPTAQLDLLQPLGQGRSLAIWVNHDSEVRYGPSPLHTISLYLDGGSGVQRIDGPTPRQGKAGTICVMPKGAQSLWRIGQSLRMLHLYLPDDILRAEYLALTGRDPGRMSLAELTYETRPELARLFLNLAATDAADPIARQAALSDLIALVLTAPDLGDGRAMPALRGGLGAARARRIKDRILTDLAAPLTLEILASEAGLSPFHFQRMFRQSFGTTPRQWVEARRVAEAARQIRAGASLAATAAATGFAHQSHMTRACRRQMATTPGRLAPGH